MTYKGFYLIPANEGQGSNLIREADGRTICEFRRIPDDREMKKVVNRILRHPQFRIRDIMVKRLAAKWKKLHDVDSHSTPKQRASFEKKLKKAKLNNNESQLYSSLQSGNTATWRINNISNGSVTSVVNGRLTYV